MATIAIIVDHKPDYLASGAEDLSILTLPLGAANVIDVFVREARSAGATDLLVMPTFECTSAYQRRIGTLTCNRAILAPLSRQREVLEGYEGGDVILVFDARYFSSQSPDPAALVDSCRQERTAAYAVSVQPEQGNAAERIMFAQDGGIKRVRRLYDKISWSHKPRSVVLLAAMPLQLAEAAPIYPMDQSRLWLVKQGIPGHDRAITGHVFDLYDPAEMLELSRRQVVADIESESPPAGYVRPRPNLLLAQGTVLPDEVRLVGPVVIKSGVRIAPGVTVIGPCVIGRDCRLDQRSLVARSILPAGSHVSEDRNVVHSIGTPNGTGECESCTQQARTSTAAEQLPMTDEELRCVQGERSVCLPGHGKRGLYPFFKRAMDVAGAILGILVTLPLLPIVALLIKLDSRGPVFFAHRREGVGGRDFPCLKFRTMRVGANDEQRALYAQNQVDGPQFNMEKDPRITRVGRWLRAMNIDELPQLVNVLLGHMSLVGPRPSPFRENQVCLPWRRARLAVRPGIAGLWQICRHDRGEGDFSQWICYDVAYVRNMSFWLDLKILFYCIFSLGGWRPVPLGRVLPTEAYHDLPASPTEIFQTSP